MEKLNCFSDYRVDFKCNYALAPLLIRFLTECFYVKRLFHCIITVLIDYGTVNLFNNK